MNGTELPHNVALAKLETVAKLDETSKLREEMLEDCQALGGFAAFRCDNLSCRDCSTNIVVLNVQLQPFA